MKKTLSHYLMPIATCTAITIQCGNAQALPTGNAIMSKTAAIYSHARTLKQDWDASVGLGKMHMQMHILMQQEGVKSHVNMNMKMNMPGMAGATNPFAHGITTEMVCNGKNITVYMPMSNTYTVRPIPASGPERLAMLKQSSTMVPNVTDLKGKFTFLKSSMVGKTPVWVVSYLATEGPKVPMLFYINRANYHLKQITMDVTSPMGPSKVVMTLLSEQINPHLDASLFNFVPPKGSHKSTTPIMGMPGMGSPAMSGPG